MAASSTGADKQLTAFRLFITFRTSTNTGAVEENRAIFTTVDRH